MTTFRKPSAVLCSSSHPLEDLCRHGPLAPATTGRNTRPCGELIDKSKAAGAPWHQLGKKASAGLRPGNLSLAATNLTSTTLAAGPSPLRSCRTGFEQRGVDNAVATTKANARVAPSCVSQAIAQRASMHRCLRLALTDAGVPGPNKNCRIHVQPLLLARGCLQEVAGARKRFRLQDNLSARPRL